MKHQFIRRAAALALALILTISLSAPAFAAAAGGDDAVLRVICDKTGPLKINETAVLTAEWAEWAEGEKPEGDPTYVWTVDNNSAIELVQNAADPAKATVTAKATGAANITLTAEWTPEGGGKQTKTATYNLEVMSITLTIVGNNSVLWTDTTEESAKSFTVRLNGIVDSNPKITWTVKPTTAQPGVVEPKLSSVNGDSTTVRVEQQTAGEFTITASYARPDGEPVPSTNSVQLTISGLVLSGTGDRFDPGKKTLDMVVNGSAVLSVSAYGSARPSSGTTLKVSWSSSDASVVSVMPDAGNLNAWRVGTADITVSTSDGRYSDYCTVTVDEDQSVIAGPYTTYGGKSISISNPLILSAVYPRLAEICAEKTKDLNHGEPLALQYITNLSVSTSQGTLYYNYNTEADTGDGVGMNDKFTASNLAGGSVYDIGKLYFVPKPGFSGMAEIRFTGIAEGNRNFSGVIKVSVGTGSGAHQISYRTQAGVPAYFAASDFDEYCLNKNGRSYNYIVFNLPRSSEGVLYYNYTAGSGNPVSTTTQFTASGRYTLDDVCFVPSAAYQGESVIISFRGVDTSGKAISGEVEVNVIQASTAGDPANVTISGERGKPVTLRNNLFNDACRAVLGDTYTLDFVTFTLPDPTEGTLYINYRGEGDYDSRVASGTHCYYSGVPGLGSISFVPANRAAGQVAIPYTGYSVGGASFSGTLYISLEEVNRSTIYYSVIKGGTLIFSVSDFNTAGQHSVGSNVSFVIFNKTDDTSRKYGTLYHRSNTGTTPQTVGFLSGFSSSSTYVYYASPTTNSQRELGRVYFLAKDTAGTVTFDYTAYSGTPTGNSSNRKELFKGQVVIQVTSLPPEDIELSCKTGGQVGLSASTVNSVCSAVMSESLSYIEITGVPDPKAGHLYYNYSGFGTGMAVMEGDRFYCAGSPGIDRLTFVPFARFAGKAEITYIGYSSGGKEQVSGRILVDVSKSTSSSYFKDMGNAAWAVDSVDYLYRNKTVEGVGGSQFAPNQVVSKGDFTLMLVRAYGLTATGSVSFSDVPAKSYYADAIRIATLLGIASGSNGKFNPLAPLTRQDAILMIYNTLKVKNKLTTNGLAADLSVYRDEGLVGAGAREAMGILVQMGVIEGDGDYLRPQRQLMRSEAAMLLHTVMTL